MATLKLEVAAIQTLMATALNGLANNAAALGETEYDNSLNLYMFGLFELNVTFGSAPTANSTVDLYLIPAPDGTNYDDAITGASGTAPITSFLGGFPLRAVTTAQKIPLGAGLRGNIALPPTKFKLFAINRSGGAFPASGSSVKAVFYRYQSA